MRTWSKAVIAATASVLAFGGVAVAAPVDSAVKLVPEERVMKKVATIFSTPLKDDQSVFSEEISVKVKLPPVKEEPPAPEPASRSRGGDSGGGESAAPAAEPASAPVADSAGIYSLNEFLFSGVIHWGGYKYTYYSQSVLPGGGLVIPGRHVSAEGYVVDGDGYIALAGSAPKGTVFPTPFGRSGKIYDRGTAGNHLDVYVR